MTCRNVMHYRDAFLDGELASNLVAEVHAHLLQCPSCQSHIEMLRAVGDVVGSERPPARLAPGFARHVVSSLPRPGSVPLGHTRIETRRERRSRAFRVAAGGLIPCAAAVLFFCVLLWPSTKTEVHEAMVLGASTETAVKQVVDPALGVLRDARQSTAHLNHVFAISTGGVREALQRDLDEPDPVDAEESPSVSFIEIFFRPFDEVLLEKPTERVDFDEEEIVRF